MGASRSPKNQCGESILSLFSLKLDWFTFSPYKNDFVSAFWKNHKTLSLLKLYTGCQVLDLDSLSTDEKLYFNDMRIEKDLLRNSRLRDRTKQLAQLTRLLCAGLPRLKGVEFYEGFRGMDHEDDDDDGLPFDCRFSVGGDGQVELVTLGARYMAVD
jgi:hypothetical protein